MAHKSKVADYELDWLVSPISVASRDEIGLERMPYSLPPGLGNAWIESLALHDGIVLLRAVHELDEAQPGQMVHLLDVSVDPAQPMFNAQIWLSGLGYHREHWDGPDRPPVEIVATPGRDTFRYHQKWQAGIFVEGGLTSEMRSVVIPDSMLISLLGEGNAVSLLQGLGLDGKRLSAVRAMPTHVSAPLREALSGHVSGVARKLYAQARVLDYLASLQALASPQNKTTDGRRGAKRLIHDLHDHLLHLEGRLPTLSDLAKEFGVPARKLNDEFNAEYGSSIYSFVTEQRLLQAHASILASNTPLKVLAARLGYSHVNHFIVAFKRKFGYSPGSLRR